MRVIDVYGRRAQMLQFALEDYRRANFLDDCVLQL